MSATAFAPPRRTATIPDLPLELLDECFSHLHDDKNALRTCSVVCHTWLPSARRYLFRRLLLSDRILRVARIDNTRGTLRACLYLRALMQPVWEALVASFVVFACALPAWAADCVEQVDIDGPYVQGPFARLPTSLNTLSLVIRCFSRLRTLSLSRVVFETAGAGSDDLQILPTLPLLRLELYNMAPHRGVLFLLRLVPSLQELLWDIYGDDTSLDVEDVAATGFGRALAWVQVTCGTDMALLLRIMQAAAQRRPLTKVTSLTLELPVCIQWQGEEHGGRTSRQISQLLGYVGPNLKELTLEVMAQGRWGDRDACGKLGLWQCPALRELRLDLSGSIWYFTILSHAHLLLDDLLRRPEGRSGTVTVVLDLYELDFSGSAEPFYRGWDARAATYLNRGLRAVRVLVEHEVLNIEGREAVKKAMPSLYSHGALEFE